MGESVEKMEGRSVGLVAWSVVVFGNFVFNLMWGGKWSDDKLLAAKYIYLDLTVSNYSPFYYLCPLQSLQWFKIFSDCILEKLMYQRLIYKQQDNRAP